MERISGQSGGWDDLAAWHFTSGPQQQKADAHSQPYIRPFARNMSGNGSSGPPSGRRDDSQSPRTSYGSDQGNAFGTGLRDRYPQHRDSFLPPQQGYWQGKADVSDNRFQIPGWHSADAYRSSQAAYHVPQANAAGGGKNSSSGTGERVSTAAPRAVQQPRVDPSCDADRYHTQSAVGNNGVPFSAYEALLKIQQTQMLELATQLAEEKAKSLFMRAEFVRRAKKAHRAQKAAVPAPPPQQAVAQMRTTYSIVYSIMFAQHGVGEQLMSGYAGDATWASLLQDYARRTSQDLEHLELFYGGMLVNLGMKMGAWRGKWRMEVRVVRR